MLTLQEFQRIVWRHYRKEGRHALPWRNLPTGRQGRKDPYRILVSEVMLQQTQVERVIPFYKKFIQRFPTAKSLAAAPLAEVLKAWQGLGYNRRGKMLRAAAIEIAKHKPRTIAELEELPGVGPYTARAVAAFAWNEDVVFVETNIRTVVIHHFFDRSASMPQTRGARAARPILPLASGMLAPLVTDQEILAVLEKALSKGKAREWYSALMDYGAYLKRSGVKINTKSKHYAKQKPFAGSMRQARGAILREYTKGITSSAKLTGLLGPSREKQLKQALATLRKEGLIQK